MEAIPALISEKSIHLFEKHKYLPNLNFAQDLKLEDYINTISLEAETMIQMAKREIFPAAMEYSTHVAQSISSILNVGVYNVDAQKDLLKELTDTINSFNINLKELEKCVQKAKTITSDSYEKACYYKEAVVNQMEKLRKDADYLESLVDEDIWPMPTYSELLFQL